LTLQTRVRRPIDFADPTHAKQGGDFVNAEAGAGREAKGLPWILWAGRQPGLDYSCLTAIWRPIPRTVWSSLRSQLGVIRIRETLASSKEPS